MRVGIAGYGVVGQRRRACIDANPHLQLVSVCDRTEVARARAPGVTTHATYQDLLDENLDALFVCLSNDMAAEVTIAGLQRGQHVFCEKPPSRTLEEMDLVMEAERKAPRRKLMYGFNHRYHESVEDALSIMRSGQLGSVISLRGVYGKSQLVTFDQSDWRTRREMSGGGVLLDQGIHMVDLLRLFGGEFSEVHSCISNTFWNFDVEDNAYALMRSEEGVVAMLHSSATQWRHRFALDVTLEKGILELAGILSGSKSYGAETLTVAWASPDNDRGEPREQRTLYNSDPSWQREVDVFTRAVLDDLPIVSGSSHDARATLELVYRIYYQDIKWRSRFTIPDPDA